MHFGLGTATQSSQSVANSTEKLFDEVLLGAEMVEQDRRLRSECIGQGPQ
jgi:hypothetical protein